jgi:hypothetical protein
MCDTTLVRIKYPDGQIEVVEQTNSQICETLQGVPREMRKVFYRGEESVVNSLGWDIKQVNLPLH